MPRKGLHMVRSENDRDIWDTLLTTPDEIKLGDLIAFVIAKAPLLRPLRLRSNDESPQVHHHIVVSKRAVLTRSEVLARASRHNFVEAEHVLCALAEEPGGRPLIEALINGPHAQEVIGALGLRFFTTSR